MKSVPLERPAEQIFEDRKSVKRVPEADDRRSMIHDQRIMEGDADYSPLNSNISLNLAASWTNRTKN